ncbi:MAG: GNAT family N-acetyltransferase [Clostridiales bacterium]|nr:GNAT family N-acetyltransferase [Candidatus Blautia equi]
MQLVEQHFGWSLPDNLSIQKVDAGTELNDELLTFIENCSWDEVKAHLTEVIRSNALTDWETFFVARVNGKIVGIVSVMKEDYYPLPEVSPWVSSVFVSEEYRGHRISGKLIAYANDYLARLGFAQSYIPSEHVGLYEKYGYHYVSDITNYGGGIDHLYEKYIK